MLKNDNRKKYRLRWGFDQFLHQFLHSKMWNKMWNRRQYKRNSNYYLTMAFSKLLERRDNYKFNEFDLYCIGHSHLDACWLWTKLSTIRRAIITFQQNIEHFERFPFYTFSQTTPQYYDWVRRLRPELFQKMLKYEKQGRWEIIGGMWVEPDLNLPNGESLVRQRLYGQLFYLEHFGKLAKIESVEDTFGFNAQLPQILLKSGAEIFWTIKITWNDLTEFPFANFLWRGIDGSEIFTHMYKCNWNVLADLSLYKRTGRRIKEQGLVFDSSSEKEVIESSMSNDRIRTCGMFYGLGDGGMGPLKEEIEILVNMVKGGLIKFSTFDEYFKKLRAECGSILPIWNDELYLEDHRGVYTSQANTKRLNRALEVNLRDWEILLSFSSIIFLSLFFFISSFKNCFISSSSSESIISRASFNEESASLYFFASFTPSSSSEAFLPYSFIILGLEAISGSESFNITFLCSSSITFNFSNNSLIFKYHLKLKSMD